MSQRTLLLVAIQPHVTLAPLHPLSSHPIEHCEECVECVEVGLDGILAVDLQLQAATEELQDHHE